MLACRLISFTSPTPRLLHFAKVPTHETDGGSF
jgi:hypothetical protein